VGIRWWGKTIWMGEGFTDWVVGKGLGIGSRDGVAGEDNYYRLRFKKKKLVLKTTCVIE